MPLQHSVEELILKNGARGLLINTPGSTSVYYNVYFHAGTNFVEDVQKSQTAHIMEHMAFGANSRFATAEEFSQEFSKNGAWHNAFTTSIGLGYYSAAPLMEWERILDLQLLSIGQPRYAQQGLDAEKGNVREEIAGYAAINTRVLWQEAMKAFGLDRWYDPKEIKTIEAVTLEDIEQHFQRTHTTNNMRFLVAGNIAEYKEAIMQKFETIQLEAGTQLTLPAETAHAPGPVFIARKDVPSLIFRLTFFVNRNLSLDERQTLDVIEHVLVGTFHSRILGEARRRGICYGMRANHDPAPTGVTEFSIGGQVQFENAAELATLIIEQLNLVKEHGVTEEELRAANEYERGSLQMSNETTQALASWYVDEYYDLGVIDAVDAAPERIARTTVADTKALLNEFIDTAIWTLAGIGDSTKPEFIKLYDMFERDLIRKEVQ